MASNTLCVEMQMGFVHISGFVFVDQPGCSYIFNLLFAQQFNKPLMYCCHTFCLFNKFILWLFLEKKLPCFRSYSPRDRSPRRRSYSRSPPPRARSLSRSPPPARARSYSRSPPPPPPRNSSRSPPATRVLSRSPPPPPARSRSRSYSRSPGQQPQRDESPYGNDA